MASLKPGNIVGQYINRFDGGITSIPRSVDSHFCQMVKNFDIHSDPGRLIPVRSTEVGDSNATAATRVRNFCIGKLSATEYALYGLAKQSATDRLQVFYKQIQVNGDNSLEGPTWLNTSNNTSSTGTTGEFDLFIYYENRGLIYASRDARYIVAYDPDASSVWNDTELDLTSYSTIRQGLVHSKDDILYVPYDNKIAKNNAGSWTAAALTLPSHMKINSICEYGNYIAVAAANKSGFGNSIVYLWDRDTSLATLADSIDWGEGELVSIEVVDGILLGISNVGKAGSSSYSSGPSFHQRIVFRYLEGGRAKFFRELVSQQSNAYLTSIPKKYKADKFLYFPLFMTFPDGTSREGIWKVGRNRGEDFAISLHTTPNNDTATTSVSPFNGFIVVGDFVLMSYTDSGTVTVRKTVEITGNGSTDEYIATSQYDTIIFNDGDVRLKKKLKSVSIMTEYLPATAQVVVKYKIDNETSFTTILTHSTDNALHKTAINIESSGIALPEYKEITFRIESTGGAVITGFEYRSEITGKDVIE